MYILIELCDSWYAIFCVLDIMYMYTVCQGGGGRGSLGGGLINDRKQRNYSKRTFSGVPLQSIPNGTMMHSSKESTRKVNRMSVS